MSGPRIGIDNLRSGGKTTVGLARTSLMEPPGVKMFHTTPVSTNIGMAYGAYLRPGRLWRRSSPRHGHARLAPLQVPNATLVTARASSGNGPRLVICGERPIPLQMVGVSY